MPTSWDLDKGNEGGGSSSSFTKFPVGLTNIRVIDPAPHQRWIHWMNQFRKSVTCPGKGCPICEIRKREKANKQKETYSMQKKFAINILNRATEAREIMEQGRTFMDDLVMVKQDIEKDEETGQETGKTLLDFDAKVRRTGTEQDDTKYRIDKGNESPLSDKDKELMETRVDLDEYFKPTSVEQITQLLNGAKWDDVFGTNDKKDGETVSGLPEEEIEIK